MNGIENDYINNESSGIDREVSRMRTRSSYVPPLEVRNLIDNDVNRMEDVGSTRSGRIFSNDVANIVCDDTELEDEPNRFNDAWNNSVDTAKLKWRDAIRKEFSDLEDRNVWRVIPRQRNMRTIRLKWVFKIKTMGLTVRGCVH